MSPTSFRTISPDTVLKAGGKPSTWFPPGGLVEQEELILNWACPIGCNLIRFLPIRFDPKRLSDPNWPIRFNEIQPKLNQSDPIQPDPPLIKSRTNTQASTHAIRAKPT